jgi:hypothetical protein
VPENTAICSPSDEATRLAGIFSWGKTLPWIGVTSPAQKEFTKSTSPIRECHICGVRLAASAAGDLIAFYQIGYGIAAFGVGPLQTWAGLAMMRLRFLNQRKHFFRIIVLIGSRIFSLILLTNFHFCRQFSRSDLWLFLVLI